MRKQIVMAIVPGLLMISSCKQEPVTQIVGAYAREIKFEQKNINTGELLGIVTTRDTIFISKKKEGYQIDNHLWKFRDYDSEGWVRISTHDGARYTHVCTYDETDHSLNPVASGLFVPAYLDFDKGLLAFEKEFIKVWSKVKP